MPKPIVSFAITDADRAAVAAAIEVRQKNSRDRDLDFSKWMREAVIEKLERDGPPGKKPSPDFLPVKPSSGDAPAANDLSTDLTRFSTNEDSPADSPPPSGPRAPRSAQAAIQKLVKRERQESK